MALTFDEGGEWNRETEHGDPNRIGSQRERERERERGGWQHSKQNGYSFFHFQLLKYFKIIN